MKKTTGKVLSFVLSLALVLTSFPAMLASASTHTVQGTLSDTKTDVIYLVNGGTDDKSQRIEDLQDYIFKDSDGTSNDCTLTTTDRQHVENAQISAISHASGDRLVKWYEGDDTDKSSIDDDTKKVDLQLRSSTVSGHEVLNVQYKATYTDDDDNDITIKATKKFDVYVYDNGETVIGKTSKATDDDVVYGKKSVELDDNFAEKLLSNEKVKGEAGDSMNLTVFEATQSGDSPYVDWVALKTASNDDFDQDANGNGDVYYTLKSSNSNIALTNGTKATYTYGTPDCSQNTKVAGDPVYTMTTAAATDKLPGIAVDSATGELTVTAITGDSTSTYVYTTDGTDPTSSSDAITADTATNIGLGTEAGTKTFKVAALNDGSIVDGSIVTGSVEITKSAAILDADCPTISAGSVSNKLTVAYTANDATAKALTYKYTVNDGTAKTVTPGTDVITVPAAVATPCTIVVTAYNGSTATGSATATVAVAVDDPTAATNDVLATVKKTSSGSITFTAEVTDWGKDHTTPTASGVELSTTKDVKVKSAIEKKIIVDDSNFKYLVKQSGSTYISKESSLDSDSAKVVTTAIKVNGLNVKFDNGEQDVKVSDKASVTEISGKVNSLDISDGSNVGSISLDQLDNTSADPKITVSDAKVGDIDFDDANVAKNELDVDSTDAVVGNVTDADTITVKSGKTGDLSANDITIDADDDESSTTVGNIEAKTLELDSEDSKLTVGTITAKNDSDDTDYNPDFKFKGSNLTVAGIDFDYRDAELEFDDFQGKVPAPKNASEDGASIQTTDGDDRVEITGDCDIDSISIEDDSILTFDGKLDVTDVDGDGTLVVGAGKMYIDGSASSTILKLSDATLTKGMTAFTSLTDTVDADDFDCYGFTLAKTAGSKIDTFKVDSIVFKGLSVNKTSDSIAKGYSANYTAYAYPGGTTMPSGYTIKWNLDGDDSIFELTTNADGTATVKVVGYDADFASNDKATLTCTMVDADGDEVDEDTYCSGECDITAIATPVVTHTSDTNANFSLAQGASYQFKITSSDGSEPTFGVGSGSLAVSKVGKSGNAYFYKVTAVGKVGDQVGVYLDKARLLVVTISASSVKLDTGAKLSVAKGKTYQFKATSTTAVKATTGNGAVFQVVKSTKTGNNTYVTVKAVGSKGQSTGIYFNGVRRTIATVA